MEANYRFNIHDGLSPVALTRFLAAAADWSEARCGGFESEVGWDEALAAALAMPGSELLLHIASNRHHSAVLSFETEHGQSAALIELYTRDGAWHFDVAGASPDAASKTLAALGVLVPERERLNDKTVDVEFWMAHPMQGAVSRRKPIDRVPFSSIADNYPLSVRPAITDLASLTGPPPGGRLLVFHGPPGTGKTRYLSSLAEAWSDWCDFHYIVDPDEMFQTALYLNTVLLDGASEDDRFMLLVIEDGDEFIDTNAKARVGQGVARLLNVADGLIGSGLNVMVLISTNVESPQFAGAVTRSGRCGALIEFPHFPADEASAWVAARGLSGAFDTDVSLADLYAQIPR